MQFERKCPSLQGGAEPHERSGDQGVTKTRIRTVRALIDRVSSHVHSQRSHGIFRDQLKWPHMQCRDRLGLGLGSLHAASARLGLQIRCYRTLALPWCSRRLSSTLTPLCFLPALNLSLNLPLDLPLPLPLGNFVTTALFTTKHQHAPYPCSIDPVRHNHSIPIPPVAFIIAPHQLAQGPSLTCRRQSRC